MGSNQSSSSTATFPGTLLSGQFRLERQLDAGGMGSVWVAEDTRLRRPVAIKFLSSSLFANEQARQRFEREARLATRIRSPHVVQVYSQGTTDSGDPFLVMELLEGEDLAHRLERLGPLTLSEAASILQQVGSALGRAHREGLIHRDIKPHNIFLTPEPDGRSFVKLLDFGIAKELRAGFTSLTMSGEVVGTLGYISPEQISSPHSAGPGSDIWALGVVIYEMLTGRLPFEADSMPELVFRISEARFVPATSLNPMLPRALDAFLARAIQPDVAKRFGSIDELNQAFAQIVQAHSSGFVIKGAVAPRSEASASTEVVPVVRIDRPGKRSWPKFLALGITAALVAIVIVRALWPSAGEKPGDPEYVLRPARAAEPVRQEPPAKPVPGATLLLEPMPAREERAAATSQLERTQPAAARDGAEPTGAAHPVEPAATPKRTPAPAPPPQAAPRPKAKTSTVANYGF